MQWLQVLTVTVGAITTILVGIKAHARSPRRIDIAAVVFAAVGTAIASMTAFYNPREEYVRIGRAMSQLSQLQIEMSFALPDMCGDEKKIDNTKRIREWYGKFASITNASDSFGGQNPPPQPEKPTQ
jgi:hypothetical protein